MSYDLFFKGKAGVIDMDDVKNYFSCRRNYKVDGTQILYENKDTGVYFLIDTQDEIEPSDECTSDYPISLNLNYYRPSFFGLEAEPEIANFVKRFDLVVEDPQMEGMGTGEYVSERFFSGWNKGNDFAYMSILKEPGNRNGIVSLPTKILHKTWMWNFQRGQLQDALGEQVFVPRVMYLQIDGRSATGIVWPDGIPIAAVEVDYLIVPRKELAPKKWFTRKEDTTLLAWEDAAKFLEKYWVQKSGSDRVLSYASPPSEVQKFVRSLPPMDNSLSVVSADKALDKELFDRYAV